MRHRTVFLLLALSLAWAGSAAGKTVIKLGVVTIPGSAQNICAEKFKEIVEARGDFEVKIFHSASLGTESELLQQIRMNSIQMGVITDGPFDTMVPEARVISYPFLFDSFESVDRVLDGPAGQELLLRLERAGFKGLAFSENGFRNLTNSKRPIHSAQDLAGLKIRVMESILHKELWRLLGANPTPMGWPIYTELQQGTIDAQENPLSVIYNYRLFEVQKYLSLSSHVYSSHIDVANLQWFQGLPEPDREVVLRSMREAAQFQRAWSRRNEADFLRKLKDEGMVVDEHPDLESFRSRVQNLKDLEIYSGKETQDLLQKFFGAIRK
ncbi:MAG: DctP family TRAP transporter solute-binding subunit [Syntrophobacteraceae bacterium]|jgi:tripartite ATP-independent transporter DctP family solute receptor|nr:DctP family TRAP transporter solute-binding subunit [Syntrophobacteraceae bacterium]